ncbi:uncharacterized protein DEA37_0012728, partial [Paragonimus westermani]
MFAGRVFTGLTRKLLKDSVHKRCFALRTPINTGILFVPEKEAWVVERLGKFYKALSPGLNFCIPFVDRIAYVQSLKEVAIEIPDQ